MTSGKQIINYTLTDEAPALATAGHCCRSSRHVLPPRRTSTSNDDRYLTGRAHAGGVQRQAANAEQQVEDGLAFLGELTQDPSANIIKLPNISASVPQLKDCIAELQSQGYELPDYPGRSLD